MVKKREAHFSDSLGVSELAGLVGTVMHWHPPRTDGIYVTVMVREVRMSYGRREALVAPEKGGGAAWVQLFTLDNVPFP